MIHLVTRANRHLYERQLQTFIALGSDDYNDEHAIYLVGLGAGGDVAIGVRLRPVAYGSILADRLPHLMAPDAGSPNGPTLEVARFVGHLHGRAADLYRGELGLAMLEAAHLVGASRIVGLTHLAQWPLLDSCGWRISLMGLPVPGRNGTRIAFEIGVSPDDLRTMRDAWAIERALIYLDDDIAAGLPVELVGRHADEWGRLSDKERRTRLVGRQLVETPLGWSPEETRDADRSAIEETLLLLETIIDQDMLERPDNDLRQQGAIMLLDIARRRLRAHLGCADLGPPAAADAETLTLRLTH